MSMMDKLQELENRVSGLVPLRKHDLYAIEAIKEAINSARNGNYGVGAILVDNRSSEIMFRGNNGVFSDARSDMHAEMDLLNRFESEHKTNSRDLLRHYALYTSLESCPMCLCRIISSGVTQVYHVADDIEGGMVHLMDSLPPVWQELSKGRTFEKADCSDDVSAIAEQIFLLTAELDNMLKTV